MEKLTARLLRQRYVIIKFNEKRKIVMERLIEILSEIKPGVSFTADTRLIADKIFDSLGIMSLVAELSNEFDIEISPIEIVPENFETVQALHDMIETLIDED